jgi:very-short-patch-repair endonuclease
MSSGKKYIESCGITFLRFKNEDVFENMKFVLGKISEKLEELSTTPKSPP